MKEKFDAAEELVQKFFTTLKKEDGQAAEAALVPFFIPVSELGVGNIETAPGVPVRAVALMGKVKAKRRHFSVADVYYTNALEWLKSGKSFGSQNLDRAIWIEAAEVKLSRGLSNQARDILSEAITLSKNESDKAVYQRELKKIPE